MQDLLPDPKDREETETGKENQEGPDNPDKPITESPIKKKLKAVKKGKGKKTDEKGEDAPGDGGVETSELNLGEKLTLDACTDEPVGEAEEKAQPPNSLEGSSHQSSAEPEGCASKEQLKEDGDASSQPSLAAEPEPEVKPPSPMLISVPVEQPSAPVQHSVFKSFFSTDLSFDDIDRQIEAKRVELVSNS